MLRISHWQLIRWQVVFNAAREPPGPLTVCPLPDARFTLAIGELALAVLFPVEPVPFELLTVRPDIHTKAVLLVLLVFTVVAATVCPRIVSLAVQLVLEPRAFVAPAIRPLVNTRALNQVFAPLTLEESSISPLIGTSSVLHSASEFASVRRPIL